MIMLHASVSLISFYRQKEGVNFVWKENQLILSISGEWGIKQTMEQLEDADTPSPYTRRNSILSLELRRNLKMETVG